MKLSDLEFEYPERLVATERLPGSRAMIVEASSPPREGALADVFALFEPGDLLVINDTRVVRRRVFSAAGLEILFLGALDSEARRWSVLCPSTRWKNGVDQTLPNGITLKLVERGRPQTVEASESLTEEFFEKHGELPLPPYIQKARGERHNRDADRASYQTAWADRAGSLAAPTASLHFSAQQIEQLGEKGVQVERVTLHVGLGTFLPVTVENLEEHVMHAEIAEIPVRTWRTIESTRANGKRVWAMGTTVTRTLESAAHGKLHKASDDSVAFRGETDLFIRPGFEFKVVTGLLTNFHQPRSTLLALVAAFAGLDKVKAAYAWAIEREFRLFSYGDLTVWTK